MTSAAAPVSIFRRQAKYGEDVVIEEGHPSADVGNYSLLHSVGVGAYAKVYRAQVKSTGAEVAAKIINRQAAPKDYVKKFLPREIEVLQMLEHPYCIRTYEIFQVEHRIHMIMHIANNGDLLDYINSRGRVPEPMSQKIFSQLVSALEYFYRISIAHRDLKCENLLLDSDFNIVVSDFGFATPYKTGQLLKTFCGSVAYACPEILYGQPYDGKKSDLWSIGVVLYALVCGQLPFQEGDMKRLLMQINSPLLFPSRLSADCMSLLSKLLSTSLKRRATLEDVKEHPWLKSIHNPHTELLMPANFTSPATKRAHPPENPKTPTDSRIRASTIDHSELSAKPKAKVDIGRLGGSPHVSPSPTISSTLSSSTRKTPPEGSELAAPAAMGSPRTSPSTPATADESPPQQQQQSPEAEEVDGVAMRNRSMSSSMGGVVLPRQVSWRKRLRKNISSYLSPDKVHAAIAEE